MNEKNAFGDIGFYFLVLGISLYLIMGACHFVDWVFRPKKIKPEQAGTIAQEEIDSELEHNMLLKQIVNIREEDMPEGESKPEEPGANKG